MTDVGESLRREVIGPGPAQFAAPVRFQYRGRSLPASHGEEKVEVDESIVSVPVEEVGKAEIGSFNGDPRFFLCLADSGIGGRFVCLNVTGDEAVAAIAEAGVIPLRKQDLLLAHGIK